MFFHAIMQCQLTWNISIEPLSLYIKTRTGSFSMSIFFNVDAATLPKCLVIIFTARVLLEEKVKSHPKVTKFSFKKLHTESEHRAWVQKTLVRTELSWCKYTANIFLWNEKNKLFIRKSRKLISRKISTLWSKTLSSHNHKYELMSETNASDVCLIMLTSGVPTFSSF